MTTIVNYFDSTCRIIIDEFNFIFKSMSDEEKREYANEKFCEADLAFRLGTPFRNLARFTVQGSKAKDIVIDHKDFQVEVKYWRNYVAGNSRGKATWANSFENDINWLNEEIAAGRKGKRALIVGWCTVFPWNMLLQLGQSNNYKSTGSKPKVNKDKIHMLPFLTCKDDYAKSVITSYNMKESNFRLFQREDVIDWRLIGEQTDEFNMVIFW